MALRDCPQGAVSPEVAGLTIHPRPPAEVRADYIARHAELLRLIDGR